MSKITYDCENCGTSKTVWESQYSKAKNHYCGKVCQGLHNKVIFDRKAYEKEYWNRPENKERGRANQKAAAKKRREVMGRSYRLSMINGAKERSKKYNLPFDLDESDFEVPTHCPILGIELKIGDKQGGNFNSPSLDRIIPELGYVRGNVIVISKRANLIKTDAAWDEILKVALFMQSFSHSAIPQESDPLCIDNGLALS